MLLFPVRASAALPAGGPYLTLDSLKAAMAKEAQPSLFIAANDLLKRTRAGYLGTVRAGVVRHSAVAYVPLFWFHRSGRSHSPFLEVGIGAETESGGSLRPFIPVAFNAGEVLSRIFSGKWARNHTSRADLRAFFLGPVIKFPLVDFKSYVAGHNIGLILAWRVGSG